jgi:SAM-dependent methyltransferase
VTATDSYLLYRAAWLGKVATVLDLGCGDGRFLEMLLDDGVNAIGVDVPSARNSVEARSATRPNLNLAARVTYLDDPERIPLADDSVDIILSNTVFEHIVTLNSTIAELARILKPEGRVYTVFPLGSAIVEQHCGLPFVHWVESRPMRLRYMKIARAIGLYRQEPSPEAMEKYIYSHVFYRRENEIVALFSAKFGHVSSDTEAYLTIKGQCLSRSGGWWRRRLGDWLQARAARLAPLVHIRHAAAYCLAAPRKANGI